MGLQRWDGIASDLTVSLMDGPGGCGIARTLGGRGSIRLGHRMHASCPGYLWDSDATTNTPTGNRCLLETL